MNVRSCLRTRRMRRPRAFSLIGILVSMALIVILFAISMSALQKSIGPGMSGSMEENQINTFADKANINAVYMGLMLSDQTLQTFPTPSVFAQRTNDKSLDTTASFYSLMIAQNLIRPEQLVSQNEWSEFVMPDHDYNYNAYKPMSGVYWDPEFKADLHQESNASFAHLVLQGERHRLNWKAGGPSTFAVLGNRGPKDGIPSSDSMACTASGEWAGNIVFADGHIEFTRNAACGWYAARGEQLQDNIFVLDDGYTGADSILTFTQAMWEGGFEMQFD